MLAPAGAVADPSPSDQAARNLHVRASDPRNDVVRSYVDKDTSKPLTAAERRWAKRADILSYTIDVRRAVAKPYLRFKIRAEDVFHQRGRVSEEFVLQTGYVQLVVTVGKTAPKRVEIWSPDETEPLRCAGTVVATDFRKNTIAATVPLGCLNRGPAGVDSARIKPSAAGLVHQRSDTIAVFRDGARQTRELPLTPWVNR
jgi:hypothetical protein